MANIARIPITNIYADGDYTGQIQVGPGQRTMNVLLDTGSSQLALNARKFKPDLAGGDRTTRLVQSAEYADGSSWTGAVVHTKVSIGIQGTQVAIGNANVAFAYRSRQMFGETDGILGLAYSALDDAYLMPQDSWKERHRPVRKLKRNRRFIEPYLTQLKHKDVVFDKFAFYTRRSAVHRGRRDLADNILNQGWLIMGGGEESKDLYRGKFQTVKVLSDSWYNTNLKAIVVGRAEAIEVAPKHTKSLPSNSIVDSGTAGLMLPKSLLRKIIAKFPPDRQALLNQALKEPWISARKLELWKWPDITFIMQGPTGGCDAILKIKPCDYWQVDAGRKGQAQTVFMEGAASDGIILGLPLMNGYFTIFDGEADRGKGEIRFARRKD